MRKMYKFWTPSEYDKEFMDRQEQSTWTSVDYFKEAKRINALITNKSIESNQLDSAYGYMSHCQMRRKELFNHQQRKV
jgi:hypothetical protein